MGITCTFGVALSFPNKLVSKNILSNKHTRIILTASYKGIYAKFENKQTTLSSLCRSRFVEVDI